jgi:hypothetical protein
MAERSSLSPTLAVGMIFVPNHNALKYLFKAVVFVFALG